ncbi:hypothetical protein ABIB51_001170 [Arthrobacter sp. UYCu712]
MAVGSRLRFGSVRYGQSGSHAADLAPAAGPCNHDMVNRPIGYWVKRLDASLEAQLDSTLARLRLTRRQWHMLSALSAGPITPEEAGQLLLPFNAADGDDAQERDMAALVRRRLVILLDGRLSLTGAGFALHSEASGLVDAARRELTAGIGADEYAMAVSVLERMSNNADRLGTR